jgi:hypothetical protein
VGGCSTTAATTRSSAGSQPAGRVCRAGRHRQDHHRAPSHQHTPSLVPPSTSHIPRVQAQTQACPFRYTAQQSSAIAGVLHVRPHRRLHQRTVTPARGLPVRPESDSRRRFSCHEIRGVSFGQPATDQLLLPPGAAARSRHACRLTCFRGATSTSAVLGVRPAWRGKHDRGTAIGAIASVAKRSRGAGSRHVEASP